MLEFSEDEHIDWFRVFIDLERSGVSMVKASSELNIPRSTLMGYKNYFARPRFEEGLKILRFWSVTCSRELEELPTCKLYEFNSYDFRCRTSGGNPATHKNKD